MCNFVLNLEKKLLLRLVMLCNSSCCLIYLCNQLLVTIFSKNPNLQSLLNPSNIQTFTSTPTEDADCLASWWRCLLFCSPQIQLSLKDFLLCFNASITCNCCHSKHQRPLPKSSRNLNLELNLSPWPIWFSNLKLRPEHENFPEEFLRQICTKSLQQSIQIQLIIRQ